jgi:PAT family beta-lactamase induction signal transducer AmpG
VCEDVLRHRAIWKSFEDPRLLLCVALGFASGLPLKLALSIVGLWLATEGLDIQTIGLFSLVGAPYTFKFLWAPLLDRGRLPWLTARLGLRRSWLLVSQVALVLAISGLGLTNPVQAVWWTATVTLLVTVLSATQDIALDAWRVETFTPQEQGNAAAATVLGYRVGMLWGAAFMLRMVSGLESWSGLDGLLQSLRQVAGSESYGAWNLTWLAMGLSMLVGVVATLLAKEPHREVDGERVSLLRSLTGPATALANLPAAGWVLVFVFAYKLSDVLAGAMVSPFLVAMGYTLVQIADVRDVLGLLASIGGAIAGGAVVAWWGVQRTLVVGGIAMMVSNLAFAGLVLVPGSVPALAGAIVFENLSSGIATAAFVAYLSSLCTPGYAATQYAWLTSLASLARTVLGSFTGWMAASMGWGLFFCATTVASLPALWLIFLIERKKVRAIDYQNS